MVKETRLCGECSVSRRWRMTSRTVEKDALRTDWLCAGCGKQTWTLPYHRVERRFARTTLFVVIFLAGFGLFGVGHGVYELVKWATKAALPTKPFVPSRAPWEVP